MALAIEAINRGSIQHAGELDDLLLLLQKDPPSGAVEVGVCFGGTLWALSQICDWVVGVDRDLSLLDQRNAGLPRTTLIEGDSASADTVEQAMRALGGTIDFIFIDAAHEPEAMLADFEAWSPVLASGGVMAFHDILGQAKDGWRELLARQPGEGVMTIERPSKAGNERGIGLVKFA